MLLLLARPLQALRVLVSRLPAALNFVPLRRALASRTLRLGDQRVVDLQYISTLARLLALERACVVDISHMIDCLVHLGPLFYDHVLGRDRRRLEVAASYTSVVGRLRVPRRADCCLDLPVRHQSLKAQQVLLLALVCLDEECAFRLGVRRVLPLLCTLCLVLILLVPARCLDSAH